MFCPGCRKPVPATVRWVLSGANGSTCPHCKASLCPRAAYAVILFLISCGLADGTLILLRHGGAPFWLAFAAFFIAFAAVYLVGVRVLLRLRVNSPATPGAALGVHPRA